MPDVTRFLGALRQHFGSKNDKTLAKSLGVGTGKLSEWKTGKLSVTLRAIRKMAEHTGINQGVLLGWLEPTATEGVHPIGALPGGHRTRSQRGAKEARRQ